MTWVMQIIYSKIRLRFKISVISVKYFNLVSAISHKFILHNLAHDLKDLEEICLIYGYIGKYQLSDDHSPRLLYSSKILSEQVN